MQRLDEAEAERSERRQSCRLHQEEEVDRENHSHSLRHARNDCRCRFTSFK
jgi:hypothetical protein